jgi:hypothetical protein
MPRQQHDRVAREFAERQRARRFTIGRSRYLAAFEPEPGNLRETAAAYDP